MIISKVGKNNQNGFIDKLWKTLQML